MDNRKNRYREMLASHKEYQTIAEQMEHNRTKEMTSGEWLYMYAMTPVLMEYILWVIRQAQKAGQKRLYFLARDGYQMYLVADTLCKAWEIPIECRYLHVSRYAIRVPEYHLLGKQCVEKICIGGIDVTFEKILKRAALTDEEIYQVAKSCGWENKLHDILHLGKVNALKETLKTNALFLELVYAHSKDAYANAIRYLEQEGLLEEGSFALVDSGWVGTLQQSLENLLKSKKSSIRLQGYYFGMYEIPAGTSDDVYHGFYFDRKHGLKRKVHFSNCLFEAVFTAMEGMTLYYKKEENEIQPVRDAAYNPNHKQLKKNLRILKEYLSVYMGTVSAKQELERPADVTLVEQLLSYLMGDPSAFEVEAYGGILFSDDVLETDLKHVSAKLTGEEIRQQRLFNKILIMTGLRQGVIRESAWIEGSIVAHGESVRSNRWHAILYKYFIYLRKLVASR